MIETISLLLEKERSCPMRHLNWLAVSITALLLCGASLAFAQQGKGNECTPAGVWYGGSVVAYHMTIIPNGPAGHYIAYAKGIYNDSVLNSEYTGEYVKNGRKYEGSLMRLATTDSDFLKPPPVGKMPDVYAGWTSLEMIDCNTLTNTIPFFGIYLAKNIWQPGIVWMVSGKTPMLDPPDIDLLDVLVGGQPIVETYHRLPSRVNPTLLHH
jgi:hypothetical protein